MLSLSRNEAVPLKTMRAGMPWDWETFPEYLDSVGRTPKGVNVMALVPLAPLYQYVVGVDQAKAQRVTDDELDAMCQLVFEAMEAGGCGWSSQITGDRGNVQRDYDGTPMVTDEMTEREIVAFSRVLRRIGRGSTQITGPLETAALIARESGRPIIWNALAPTGSVNQHGESRYPHLETIARLDELNQQEGVRVLASAQIVRFKSEIVLEDYNLMDIFPAWREASLGTARGEDREVQRPRAPAGAEGSDRHDGWRLRRRAVSDGRHHGELDLERRAERAAAEGALRGLHHRRDRGPGRARTRSTRLLDIAVAGRLNVGFGTTMIPMDPQAVKDVATSSVALPGISDGGAHTKFVTTARFATGAAGLLGARARDHVVGRGALAPLRLPGHGRRPERPWRARPRARPPT